jgi:hypothetical protein
MAPAPRRGPHVSRAAPALGRAEREAVVAEQSGSGTRSGEKRGAKRRRWRAEVRFWNDDFEARAFTSDISNTGVLLETTRRLPLGTRLHLEVVVAGRSFFSEATVARRQDYPAYAQSLFKPALGVRFVGLLEALERAQSGAPDRLPDGEPAAAGAAPAAAAPAPQEPEPVPVPEEPPTRPVEVPPGDGVAAVVDLRAFDRLREVFSRDLCKGALWIEPRGAARLGDELRVLLRLPPPNGDIPLRGRVVSTVSGSRGVGLLLEERRQICRRLEEILGAPEP